ncbi:Rab-family small GTPase (macronuclear) [Tetrahymena thermophila SB210]|uniref:Rab-family small GTPase n=1 Tax=Tetrahymena thermophila (strain SB210) TaxID=312017 RepID=Q22ZG1_TETTS|nr:Rab-family small GTPase [Tetrahymena thermophila SB210]EAR90686.1 Rab-family small GTPase [Tetrahymena thermophila SB210]|eukprot:XP_001010931.1 Rab-family small GTPase [Tetrahymena thermophila SB210]
MDKEKSYDLLYKFIIIGNTSTGKTCTLHNFLEGKFKKNSSYTIGVEFGSKVVTAKNKNIKLQIWDTAGQERFKSVARTYYRGGLGAIIVYDITDVESFHSVKQWIADARELARSDICIAVCGNKCDLKEERQVSQQDAENFCKENNVMFFEISALTGENVENAFLEVTKVITEMVEKGQISMSDLKPRITAGLGEHTRKPDLQEQNQNMCSC